MYGCNLWTTFIDTCHHTVVPYKIYLGILCNAKDWELLHKCLLRILTIIPLLVVNWALALQSGYYAVIILLYKPLSVHYIFIPPPFTSNGIKSLSECDSSFHNVSSIYSIIII